MKIPIFLTIVAVFGISQAIPVIEDNYNLIDIQDIIKDDNGIAFQQDDSNNGDAETQLWGFLAHHAGRLLCSYVKRPKALEQGVNRWINEDAQMMMADSNGDSGIEGGDNIAKAEFLSYIKRLFNKHKGKIHAVGRTVCRTVYGSG